MEEKHHTEEIVVEETAVEDAAEQLAALDRVTAAIEELKGKYPQISVSEQQIITVPIYILLDFMFDLRDNYAFDFLTNETAVDYPDQQKFEVIYNLNSTTYHDCLFVKAEVDRENPEIPSIFPVWGGANWQEREVYDLLGIVFTDHPNLKRILLDDAFDGYPLRRDFKWEVASRK
ncbi:NADH dehydrogenase (ubiquinone) 30 kDa subunit [Desulfofarcimen acetoxidans DSM 771]|uniref:NADH-quinone oxidoreductase n=1 Tax=Desulfofarcimen acetoxidans (strain ATCC 49208 / DSM 771 / KCTC 5769 / VKM B-1644 / 5575) TaxID=485916 RepID=C8W5A9_DESAS|nr:NADH-quinone oxidoreductase subunit C [Desulfofarcimen acetoxidans]ACV62091.1 NADH dehydrogenase (ubiquinone) 30 kDa subunit [Desulfofarcimen acetoxidans DSM 771]